MADIKTLLQPAIKFLQLEKLNEQKAGGNNQVQSAPGNQISFQKTNENELQECNFEADMKAGNFNFENNMNSPKAEENKMQISEAGNAQNNVDSKDQGQTQGTPDKNQVPQAGENSKNDKIQGAENAQGSKSENNFFSSGEDKAGFNEELANAFKELEKLKNG